MTTKTLTYIQSESMAVQMDAQNETIYSKCYSISDIMLVI